MMKVGGGGDGIRVGLRWAGVGRVSIYLFFIYFKYNFIVKKRKMKLKKGTLLILDQLCK